MAQSKICAMLPVRGSTSDVINPLLESDFLKATDFHDNNLSWIKANLLNFIIYSYFLLITIKKNWKILLLSNNSEVLKKRVLLIWKILNRNFVDWKTNNYLVGLGAIRQICTFFIFFLLIRNFLPLQNFGIKTFSNKVVTFERTSFTLFFFRSIILLYKSS